MLGVSGVARIHAGLQADLVQRRTLVLRQLVASNPHPRAISLHQALVERFGIERDPANESSDVWLEDGLGATLATEEGEFRLGRPGWAMPNDDSSEMTFAREGTKIASFRFGESLRDGAAEEIRRLREAGYAVEILSGDPDRARVARTGEALNLPPNAVRANLSPEEKAERVRAGGAEHTLFAGDGGNDSPALEAAACRATPATGIRSIEGKADFVFLGRGFRAIRLLLHSATRRRRTMTAVFTVAVLYNLIAVAVCLAGWMNPLLAAVLMPISSLVTTAIATRV